MNQEQRQEAMIARRAEWQRVVAEAGQSQLPIRQFCRQRHIPENRFYHWRRVLNLEQRAEGGAASKARFVLVRPEAEQAVESSAAMLELVLDRGWRLRIPRGTDEATLRSVLAALAPRP
jgi:hypothetical protein